MSGKILPFPTGRVHRPSRRSIEERFLEFHETNPNVYQWLRYFAIQAVSAGRRRLGIKHLIERARWEVALVTQGTDSFKVNNDHAPHYARLLMANEPLLAGVFETRVRRSP